MEKKDPEVYVFKMIDGLLIEKSDVSEVSEKDKLERLLHLEDVGSEFCLSPLEEAAVCPVCPGVVLLSPREVWHHTHSRAHTARM